MNKKAVIVIISVVVLISIAVLVIKNSIPDMEPVYKSKKLTFSKLPSLFLKSCQWGLTYDHKVVVLSTDSTEKFSPDSTKEFIYRGASFLYYRTSNDSLWLYLYSKSNRPPFFKSKIKVIQIELENPDMIKLYSNEAYKSKGLIKFE